MALRIRCQRLLHDIGSRSDYLQVCARCLIGLGAALFPIAKRTDRDVKTNSKVLLAEAKRSADDLCAWRALHPLPLLLIDRLGIRIAQGCSVPLLIRHRVEGGPIRLGGLRLGHCFLHGRVVVASITDVESSPP